MQAQSGRLASVAWGETPPYGSPNVLSVITPLHSGSTQLARNRDGLANNGERTVKFNPADFRSKHPLSAESKVYSAHSTLATCPRQCHMQRAYVFLFRPTVSVLGVQSIDTDNDAGLPHPRGQHQTGDNGYASRHRKMVQHHQRLRLYST